MAEGRQARVPAAAGQTRAGPGRRASGPHAPAPRRGGRVGVRRVLAVASACLAIALASACAGVPDGGVVTSATMAQNGGQPAGFVQMIPSGPQPGWDPDTIVYGFLLASANFTNNHAIAREYLTPPAARAWRPGSSVLEFADMPSVVTNSVQANTVTMQATGNLLGTISEDGQYQAAEQGTVPSHTNFTVVRVKGQWRIVNPPDELLFSKRDVSRAFSFRDLYFFDPSLLSLVPDPVYIPAEATAQQLVARLVAALQQGPQGWLESGTKTAFPPGTALLGTSVTGGTATVNLGGAAAAAPPQQREQMAQQLLQTLAGPTAYPQPDAAAIQSVVFAINGKPVHLSSCAALQLSMCQPPVASAPDSDAYYVDTKGRVATLSGPRSDSPQPGPAAAGQVVFDQIAVSPDQMTLAGVSGGAVYTGGLTQNGTLTRQLTATAITSLSWDTDGLWVVGRVGQRTQVWWLDHGVQPVPVSVPNIGPVTVLRVAPDGVRVAMVTGSGARARLWLAAIVRDGSQVAIGQAQPPAVPIGTDVTDFTELIWYDTGDVIALTQPPSGSLLYEVPVDGGPSRPIVTQPHTVSIAVSLDGQLLAALSDGTLVQLPDLSGSIWQAPAAYQQAAGAYQDVHGHAPVYPG